MDSVRNRSIRHVIINDILQQYAISSQSDLLERLLEYGYNITQATLSRDLEELGAIKIRVANGGPGVYKILDEEHKILSVSGGTDRLARHLNDLMISCDSNSTIAVIRTPPGAANFLASTIDRAQLSQIIGTIAGDDTIFVLAREGMTGKHIIDFFYELIM